MGMSAENLSLQIQILSGIPLNFPLQIQTLGPKQINSVIISATTVLVFKVYVPFSCPRL